MNADFIIIIVIIIIIILMAAQLQAESCKPFLSSLQKDD